MKGRTPAPSNPTQDLGHAAKPPWLSPRAAEEWDRVSVLVDLDALDTAILAAYCETFAELQEHYDKVRSGKSFGKQHPAKLADQIVKTLRGLCADLGFSPASKGRIAKKESVVVSALAAFREESE